MRDMLEYQADRIEAVLAQHRVPARVTGGTVTPRWVRFQVVPSLDARVNTIKNLHEELALALGAEDCRVSRQGAVVSVEVPRAEPATVDLMSLYNSLDEVPPYTALLGLAEDGAPLLIRLPSPDVAHILVAGMTGSGKTVLLQAIIASLALRHPVREELLLVLIDPKRRAFAPFNNYPQLARPVIWDVVQAGEALYSLTRLMEQRDLRGENGPRVVVVIDELADLRMEGGETIERCLTRLTQRGREAGIHVIAATQKPTAAVVGSLAKANFPVRLVGKVSSAEDAKVASSWRGTGAERLTGRGDFLAIAEGRLLRFQAAHITSHTIDQIAGRLPGAGVVAAAPLQFPEPADDPRLLPFPGSVWLEGS